MPAVPALAQILIVFSLVVTATARKAHLGLAAALGGVALALWNGMGIVPILGSVAGTLVNPDTLLLFALLAAIMAFSSAMKKSGALEKFSEAVLAFAPSRRVALALAPFLIGTLPMPGGAILSAPLVEAMGSGSDHGPGGLAAANYWFRHSLELVWPLYPAFILSTSMSGIPITRLIALNFYTMPLLFALGLAFIVPRGRAGRAAGAASAAGAADANEANRAAAPFPARILTFVRGIAPLLVVLGVYIFFSAIWPLLTRAFAIPAEADKLLGRYAPVFLGLVAGSATLLWKGSGAAAFRGSLGFSTVKLVGVIAGVKVFSNLIGDVGVAVAAAGELTRAGIPAIAAIALIPLITGVVTGVGFAYVGLSFPIILGMAGGLPSGAVAGKELAVVLAGAFGFSGMMLSPLHVCMVVTAEHFGTGLSGMYRRFVAPVLVFLAVAMAYVAALSALR